MAYNHFVPKRLLKGFADEDGHVCVYDCEGMRLARPKHHGRAGGSHDAYPETLEVGLNKHIEDPFNKQVLAKLERGKTLLPPDIPVIVKYLLTMYRRVPAGRERVAQNIGPVAQDIAMEFEEGLQLLAAADSSRIEQIENWRKRAAAAIEQVLAQPQVIWHDTVLRDEVMSEAAEISLRMSWDCLTLPHGKQLLMSDNPVVRSPDGLRSPTAWVLMPISSTKALRGTWRPGPTFTFSRISSAEVKAINERIAAQATRFVYFQRHERWVVPLIKGARCAEQPSSTELRQAPLRGRQQTS